MATPRSQRIGIWIIAIVMMIGTLGSFAVMVLANDNAQKEQADQAKVMAEYQAQQQQAAEENAAKSQPIKGYKATKFDSTNVKDLKKEVLVKGKGAAVKETDTVNVSYFGWLASGKIFDSSTKSGKDTPVDLSLSAVIPGWTEGLKGQKIGSVVRLTIPADKAYGSQASGVIPANSPLMFIVKLNKISEAAN